MSSLEEIFREFLERDFWRHVDRGAEDECWEWKGERDRRGYGWYEFDGKKKRAPRMALELHVGEAMPSRLFVLHHCDNPPCVNPRHLWLGTHTDNMRDAAAKGRLRQQKAARR